MVNKQENNNKTRTQKSVRNIIFALGAQCITTVLAFVSRTVMVNTIGLEAISINGLFTEVISALSLAELGVGSAIVYNLYKPLAIKDEKKICQLMTLFQTVYRIIAGVTLALGLLLCPFIQYLVKDIGLSIGYLRLVYILFVLQISSSYLFTYKASLLNADQNTHIYSTISTIVKTSGTILSIFALLLTKNYIVYLLFNIFTTLSINVVVSRYVDTLYPYLRKDTTLPKEEKSLIFNNVKNIFIKQLSGKITNSTDNILISVLVSTLYVGYYSFYAIINNTFKQLFDQIENGILHSFGNLYASDDNERCRLVLNRLTWIYGVIAIVICTCIFVCIKPFITIWIGEKYVLPNSIAFILTINLFAYIVCKPIYSAMHVSGFFVEGRNISIIGSTANLITSVLLGLKLGMLGIFIGTFITYLLQIVLKVIDVYKLRFKMSCYEHAKLWMILCFDLFVSMFVSKVICSYVLFNSSFLQFLFNGIVGVLISVLLIIISSYKTEEWHYAMETVQKIFNKVTRKNSF